jgi:hypothetical protein
MGIVMGLPIVACRLRVFSTVRGSEWPTGLNIEH